MITHRFSSSSTSRLEQRISKVKQTTRLKLLQCFGNRFINEETITWLYLSKNQDFEVALPHVELIRIRWLVLTRNLASTMTTQSLTGFAKAVTILSQINFCCGEYAVDIDQTMNFLGPNLVEFNPIPRF